MVSSNFERLMFDLYGRDGKALTKQMSEWKANEGAIDEHRWRAARQLFDSWSLNDEETCSLIKDVYEQNEYLIDPHTAIGVGAARECRRDGSIPMITLATAHPVKFPEAVEKSGVDVTPELPHHMKDLFDREERYEVLANDMALVHQFVADNRRS